MCSVYLPHADKIKCAQTAGSFVAKTDPYLGKQNTEIFCDQFEMF